METSKNIFWGLVVKPNKRYETEVQEPFRITKACLEPSTAEGKVSSLFIECGENNEEFILANLNLKNFNETLDIAFNEGEKICFKVDGPGTVHLSGNLLDHDEDGMNGMEEDSDSEEESEEETIDDNPKRSNSDSKINKSKSENKKAKVESESSDEDESDDDSDDDSSDEDESEEESKNIVNNDKVKTKDVADPVKPAIDSKVDKSPKTPNQDKKSAKKDAKTPVDPKSPKTPKDATKTNNKIKEGQTPAKSPKTTLKGGMIVEDLVVGTGTVAKKGNGVGMYYRGWLKSNNKQFDACQGGKPFKFKLGAKQVITGWDLGVAGMKVGGKRRLTIPAPLGYGSSGAPPDIPPNATLCFDVECKFVKVYGGNNVL